MVNFSTIYRNIRIKQLIVVLMASVLLTACSDSAPNPVCVGSDDLGNNATKTQSMDATNSAWVDSGITVESGKKLTITSKGSIYLCQSNPVVEDTKTFTPSSTNGSWQDSGITILKGYKYTFDVTGQYNLWGSDQSFSYPSSYLDSSGQGKYFDYKGYLKSGRGLFAYIGNNVLTGTNVGTEVQDDTDNFFEMYRRDTTASTIMPSNVGYGTSSIYSDGKLWFRYRDNGDLSDTNVADSFLYDYYSDNRGNYTVTVKRYGPCYGQNGKYMQASIGDTGGSGTMISNIGSCYTTDTSSDTSSNVCSNGTYSTLAAPASGKVWLKINDSSPTGDGSYSAYVPPVTNTTTGAVITPASGSNSGAYSVSVTTVKVDDQVFSKLVNNIVDPIRDLLLGVTAHGSVAAKDGLTKTMYNNLTANGTFVQGVRALMALSVAIFAFQFMSGISSITHREFFHLSIKMAIIITMTGPKSWDFFSTYLFSFFIQGTDSLIMIMSNNINDLVVGTTSSMVVDSTGNAGADQGRSVFSFLNSTLTILFSKEANIKLQALFVSFPLGPLMAGVMYIGIFFFLYALIKAILTYLAAIIMTALLIFMAPIFICFILFEKTKPIFERWLKQLVGFALQPIFIFIVLAIFNVFIVLSLYSVLNYTACYSCIFTVDLPISEIVKSGVNFDTFCAMHGYLPWGVDSSQDMATKISKTPVGLFYVAIFVILANVMLNFLDWIDTLANTLTGANSPSVKASAAAGSAMTEATAMGKQTASMAAGSAKFGLNYSGKALNVATLGGAGKVGTAISDSAKRTVRNALPKMLTTVKDNTGEHVMRTSLMTAKEKKGYLREQGEFNKLSTAGRQAVRDAKTLDRDIYKITKGGNSGVAGRALDKVGLKGFAVDKLGVKGGAAKVLGLRGRAEIESSKLNSHISSEARLRQLAATGGKSRKAAKTDLRAEGGLYNANNLKAMNKATEAGSTRQKLAAHENLFQQQSAATDKYKNDKPLEEAARAGARGSDAFRSGKDILSRERKLNEFAKKTEGKPVSTGEWIRAAGSHDSVLKNRDADDKQAQKKQKLAEEKAEAKDYLDKGKPLSVMEQIQRTISGDKAVAASRQTQEQKESITREKESRVAGLRQKISESGEKTTLWDRLRAGSEEKMLQNKLKDREENTRYIETATGERFTVVRGKVTGREAIHKDNPEMGKPIVSSNNVTDKASDSNEGSKMVVSDSNKRPGLIDSAASGALVVSNNAPPKPSGLIGNGAPIVSDKVAPPKPPKPSGLNGGVENSSLVASSKKEPGVIPPAKPPRTDIKPKDE